MNNITPMPSSLISNEVSQVVRGNSPASDSCQEQAKQDSRKVISVSCAGGIFYAILKDGTVHTWGG